MTRHLLRLAALGFALSTTFALHTPRLANAAVCGNLTGNVGALCQWFCYDYYYSGALTFGNGGFSIGNSCLEAQSDCVRCTPPGCPSGQAAILVQNTCFP